MSEPSRPRARTRRILSLSLGVVAVAGLSLAAVPAQADEPTSPIPNTKPLWVSKAARVGTAPATTTATARVYLAPKGGLEALKADALAVSTPGSATYGRFLTPEQYARAYQPTDRSVKLVRSYLESTGLKVTGVEDDNRWIGVTGEVADVQKAFHTTIGKFDHQNRTVEAPADTLRLPDSIAGLVTTVTGLDTTPHKVKPAAATPAPPPAGFRNARPCSAYYGQLAASKQADFKTPLPKFKGKTLPYAVCGYTGAQYRGAYEGGSSLDGTGVTVAIVDAYASPTIAADANRYATEHGDGAYKRGQLTQVTPAANAYTHQDECDPSGWFGEETLDVEAVHAMATGANIRYYGAKSCYDDDFLDTLAKVVKEDKVSLVSNSWGEASEYETTDAVAAYEQTFLQGAMEGISFLFSSGDDGDELANTGLKQVDYPTSDPYVTSVGGTVDAIGVDGTLLGQTGWGTQSYALSSDGKSWTGGAFLYGSGGGTSTLFNKPSYQNGTVGGGSRQVPDMAMDADPNAGMLVGETQTFTDGVYYDEYRIGGTSLASPLFAGLTALSIQQAGHDVGLLNPSIYGAKSAFTDVTTKFPDAGNVRANFVNGENPDDGLVYSVRTFGQDSSLSLGAGYDNTTGIGAPNPKWLTALK